MEPCSICEYNLNTRSKYFPDMLVFYERQHSKCARCYIKNLSDSNHDKDACCKNAVYTETIYGQVCTECGVVKENSSNYTHTQQFTESGNPISTNSLTHNGIVDIGMSTCIAGSSYRVHKYSNNNKRDINIYKELREEFSRLDLPKNVSDMATQLFMELCGTKKGAKKHIFKGKRRIAMKAVCLWVTFKQLSCERNYIDICDLFVIDKKKFCSELKRFNTIQGDCLSIIDNSQVITMYIEKLREIVDISFKDQKIIEEILSVLYNQEYIKNTYDIGNKIGIYFFLRCMENESKFKIPVKYYERLNTSKYMMSKSYTKLLETKNEILNSVKFNLIKKIFIRSRNSRK